MVTLIKYVQERAGIVIASAFVCAFLLTGQVAAQDSTPPSPQEMLERLDEAGRTKLPIEGQRFRIDYEIDEITLVFFRKRGSSPVILVQPDGSKWYAARHPREHVTWHSEAEFDMITIDKPQRGPWQVVGRIKESSSALVVTEVKFHPEELANPLYVDEVVRVTGTLSNGGEPIEAADFRDVVKLDVVFISSNNPDFDNFGVDPERVGHFLDDGRDFDEAPGDGTFTGDFKLRLQAGEYRPTYRVTTPMFSRSLEQQNVIVERNPIDLEIIEALRADEDHQLKLTIDTEVVQLDSLAINGNTLFPNAERREFSFNDVAAEADVSDNSALLTIEVPNYAYGNYVVDIDVFATDRHNREIRIELPLTEFVANEPLPAEPTAAERAELERERKAAAERARQQELEQQQQQMIWRVLTIVMVNVVLISLAFLVWWGWRRLKRKKSAAAGKKNTEMMDSE